MNEGGTKLASSLARLIRTTGPVSLAQYMAEANAHYYAHRDPLGADGDFTTAPEISQMFGELVGLWLTDIWRRAGAPEPVLYCELGPGRGTLAADGLRTMASFGLRPQVHLVEASPVLRACQAERAPGAVFHDDLASVPQTAPLLLIANEFFDALPIRQLISTGKCWREVLVGLEGERFVPLAGDRPMTAAVPAGSRHLPEGTIIETAPAAAAVMGELARRLADQGGAALVIDYGYWVSPGITTLQAVRGHAKADPFAEPGEADLSAHVDFAALAQIALSHGARHMGTISQGAFLTALGIDTRTAALVRAAPAGTASIEAARERLVAPTQMGELFKVIGLAAPSWPTGAGFDDEGQGSSAS